MKPGPFLCPSCRKIRLLLDADHWGCPSCASEYPLAHGVPLLFPSDQQLALIVGSEHESRSLDYLRAVYDRAYSHEGLMGTDLDEAYDQKTKSVLLSFAEPLGGKRLLDVGTGVGRLWDYIDSEIEGHAQDLSTIGLSKAVQRHPTLTVSASIAECIPYSDGFFGVVVAADTIEHTFSPQRALQEIHRVLVPGGILSVSFPVPNSLRKWGWNRLVRRRPQVRFVARLVWALLRRTLLFGRPDFQPIDRDYDRDDWVRELGQAGFSVDRVQMWPQPPDIPIVYLMRATRV